ncbi:MAG: metal-dependent hydrolase [Candidatus Aminicenantes bacterium]|nr:metal-dependent hydrolase [Candidatus Aminicenantes bacterium]
MTPFPHAAVGLIGWKYADHSHGLKALLIFVFVSCLPDADFVLYPLLGKPDWLLHQRYTHNVSVALLSALIFFPFLRMARARIGLVLVALSHLVMDVFVVDTLAPIGFRPFLPFSDAPLNFGVFPFVKRGTVAQVLSAPNLIAFGLELGLFVLPALILCRKEIAALRKNKSSV